MGIWHITIACSYSEKKMVVRLENDFTADKPEEHTRTDAGRHRL